MSKQPILQIEQLRTYFQTGSGIAKAVDGVSLNINKGETYALVGESGCGKSVTALSILQLVAKPAGYIAGGRILLHGQNVAQLPPIAMRSIRGNQVSMIFQEPMTALNPVFTVGNQIAEAILLHQKVTKDKARAIGIEMLDKVGIPDPDERYSEYPHQMSGGMRQRIMIAMALACEPELLIADEPTTALDVTIQSQILDLMKDLQKDMGTAILLITHDMGVVQENADRIGVMYAGKIVEEASKQDIFANPSHPYTRLLLRSIPSKTKRDVALATIKGRVPKATEWPKGCRFAARCPLVMARCQEEDPEEFDVSGNHTARCFLLDKSTESPDLSILDKRDPTPASALDASVCRFKTTDLQMHFPIRKGLFKRIVGQVKAVDGVNLSIHKGETLALVGESGCGKTTVGKCIVRLYEPSGGSMLYGRDELTGLDRLALKPYRRNMQMIFQDPFSCLNPRMMIGETIMEGMETHSIGKDRASRLETARGLLPKVGLDPDMLSRYPHEFSGGQRQRIGVARALAVEPELIICDEATSSLDVSVQAQILNLLKDLQSELGLSYLFITHDLGVVEYLADRVAVMYLGRIVEEGTTEEIFQSPAHPYTKALLSAVPQSDKETGAKKITLEGDVPSPIDPPAGCHFHPRCREVRQECPKSYPCKARLTETHSCNCILYAK